VLYALFARTHARKLARMRKKGDEKIEPKHFDFETESNMVCTYLFIVNVHLSKIHVCVFSCACACACACARACACV